MGRDGVAVFCRLLWRKGKGEFQLLHGATSSRRRGTQPRHIPSWLRIDVGLGSLSHGAERDSAVSLGEGHKHMPHPTWRGQL